MHLTKEFLKNKSYIPEAKKNIFKIFFKKRNTKKTDLTGFSNFLEGKNFHINDRVGIEEIEIINHFIYILKIKLFISDLKKNQSFLSFVYVKISIKNNFEILNFEKIEIELKDSNKKILLKNEEEDFLKRIVHHYLIFYGKENIEFFLNSISQIEFLNLKSYTNLNEIGENEINFSFEKEINDLKIICHSFINKDDKKIINYSLIVYYKSIIFFITKLSNERKFSEITDVLKENTKMRLKLLLSQ